MKLLNFFPFLWAILALLDPDSDSEYRSGSNPDPYWIRIRNTEKKRCFLYNLPPKSLTAMDVMAQARYLLSSRPRLLISLPATLGVGNQTPS
jgi:hypothetical protein